MLKISILILVRITQTTPINTSEMLHQEERVLENMALLFGTGLVIFLLWPVIKSCFLFQQNKDKPVQGLDEVISADKLKSSMVLYFYSPNCGPCRKMTPRIDKLLNEGASIEKINVVDHKEFAVKLGVVGLPFMALVDGGMLKRTILGPTSERRVRGLLAHSDSRSQAA